MSSRARRPSEEARRGSARGAPTRRRAERRTRRGRAADAGQGRTQRADRPHRRSGAHVSARDGLGRAPVARGRDRHRQAHRGRPRGDDRRLVREPADLPGHHHLARRAQRRQDPAARHHRPRSDLCRPRGQAWAPASSRRQATGGGAAGAMRLAPSDGRATAHRRSRPRRPPRPAAAPRRAAKQGDGRRRAASDRRGDLDEDDLENSSRSRRWRPS